MTNPAESTLNTAQVTLTEFLLARVAEDEEWAAQIGQPDGHYPDPYDPGAPAHHARVLAECEAKRRIVGTGEFPTHPMRILAAVYSDHPDYRQEWRP